MNITIKELTDLLARAASLDSPLAPELGHAADKLRKGQLDLIFVNSDTQEQVHWPISDLVSNGTPIDAQNGDDLELWVQEIP